jgi:hypothetical protein
VVKFVAGRVLLKSSKVGKNAFGLESFGQGQLEAVETDGKDAARGHQH